MTPDDDRLDPLGRLRIRAAGLAMRAPDRLARWLARVPEDLDGQPLDLRTRWFLTVLRLDRTEHHRLPVGRQRAEIDAAERAFARDPLPGEPTGRDVPLPGRYLRLRCHGESAGAPGPTLLYLHGGGFVTGRPEGYDPFCSRLAARGGCRVLSLAYRLAPEHPFPAAVDDVVDGFRWVRARAGELGIDPSRLAVGGDSAGGNLAAVLANTVGADEAPLFQLLLYPATDAADEAPSRGRYARGFYLANDHARWFTETYTPDRRDRLDPRVSPLRARRFGAVPALLVLAGLDPLVDEGRAYGERLRAAGVPVEVLDVPGMVHGFVSLDRVLPAAAAAVDEVCARVRARFAGAETRWGPVCAGAARGGVRT